MNLTAGEADVEYHLEARRCALRRDLDLRRHERDRTGSPARPLARRPDRGFGGDPEWPFDV